MAKASSGLFDGNPATHEWHTRAKILQQMRSAEAVVTGLRSGQTSDRARQTSKQTGYWRELYHTLEIGCISRCDHFSVLRNEAQLSSDMLYIFQGNLNRKLIVRQV